MESEGDVGLGEVEERDVEGEGVGHPAFVAHEAESFFEECVGGEGSFEGG